MRRPAVGDEGIDLYYEQSRRCLRWTIVPRNGRRRWVSPPLEDEAMPFSRLLSAAVVASALLSLPGSAPAFAQGASPAQPVLRSAKERGNPLVEHSLVGGLTKEK